MSKKNRWLAFITVAMFLLGFLGIYVTNSMVAVFAILLALYVTLQSAIETADFDEQADKDVFIFVAKVLVTLITCLSAIFANKS